MKFLDFHAFSLIRLPSKGINVYYDLHILYFKDSAENVILKRLFTLGLGQVLRGNGGGDSVVFQSVISHMVAFCRSDGFKSLSWAGASQARWGGFIIVIT